jgi:hypothetical protein
MADAFSRFWAESASTFTCPDSLGIVCTVSGV